MMLPSKIPGMNSYQIGGTMMAQAAKRSKFLLGGAIRVRTLAACSTGAASSLYGY